MNYSAATYIIICVFIIYLFDVFKVQSFRLNNIDLKKSVEIKIFQLIKGLAVVAYTVIPWGHTLWGTRVLVAIFLLAVLGDIFSKNKVVKAVNGLSVSEKERLCRSANMLYLYFIPYMLVCVTVIVFMNF
mgnify:CR=1 FL=1